MGKKDYKEDLSGRKFGRLTVENFHGRLLKYSDRVNKQTVPHWGCVCDCGTIVVLPEFAFKYGNTKSCGCLGKDLLRQRSKTHGESKQGCTTLGKT